MKKIKFLCVTIVTLLATTLNAQIVYTDITDGVPLGIDFNSDGTMEFDLSTGTNPGDYIEYWSYGADNNIHAIGTISTQDWDTPNCVAAGFIVGPTNQWEGQGDCSVNAWGGVNSTITYNQDEYLAVRFNLSGTAIYYGWIRFSMNNSGIMTYKDYAYNSTPNTVISTGDMGSTTGINNFESTINFTVYPNPAKNTFTISNKSALNISKVEIIDILEKKVKEIYVSAMTNTLLIDVSELNKGAYFIKVNANQKSTIQKIILN